MKSLSAFSRRTPIDILALILAARWGAEAPTDGDLPRRASGLERAMRDTIASRFVWEHLDDDERRVLFAVVGPRRATGACCVLVPERARHRRRATGRRVVAALGAAALHGEVAQVQGGELVGQRATFYGYAIPRNPRAEIEEKPIIYVPTELATGLYATAASSSAASRPLREDPRRAPDALSPGRPRSDRPPLRPVALRPLLAQRGPHRDGRESQPGRSHPLRPDSMNAPLRRSTNGCCVQRARALPRRPPPDRYGRPGAGRLLHTLEEYALVFDTFSRASASSSFPRDTRESAPGRRTPARAADLVERTVPAPSSRRHARFSGISRCWSPPRIIRRSS